MRVTTVVVLGAGELGGAVAHALAASDVVRRITLVDDASDVARGKALDIAQAGPVEPLDAELAGSGDPAVAIGASAIIVADRYGPAGEWRGDEGLQLLARLRTLAPRALVVCAGCAQLDLVERAVLEQDADRRRLVASAPEALRSAIAALTSLEAGCSPGEVSLAVLGRPPGAAIVPWDEASIAGQRATEALTTPALARLDARLPRLWPLGPIVLASAATRVLRLALGGGPGSACVFGVPEQSDEVPGRGAALPARFSAAGATLAIPRLAVRDRVRLDGVLGR